MNKPTGVRRRRRVTTTILLVQDDDEGNERRLVNDMAMSLAGTNHESKVSYVIPGVPAGTTVLDKLRNG